eukprot:jgi/Ulvmu1/10521/UM064_0059.1
MTYEEALSSEANLKVVKSALNEPEVAFALPDAYVKPSLELIHGATTRLDELCNTILNYLKCNCVQDEPVQLPSRGGGKKDAIVRHPVEGQETNAVNKQYIVEVEGSQRTVAMSDMIRACTHLTKSSVKSWLNSVSRQQSLGIKGMTCVWLVRPELLAEHHIPDKLPPHIDQQLKKTAKRREQRQRAKQRAKQAALQDNIMVSPHITGPPAQSVEPVGSGQGLQQQLALVQAQAMLLSTGTPKAGAPPLAASSPTSAAAALNPALLLQRLAQPSGSAGAAQLATAAAAPGPNSSEASGAATSTTHAGPAAAAVPPEEALEESEARLEDGSLKQAIFSVLRAAGPAGLAVAQIMDGLKAQGFDWGSNTRAGKSSISSTCGHDRMFLRLGPGRFTLRALPGALDHVDASATCSRQELDAVKMVCTLEARHAAAQARMTASGLSKQQFTKNTFKCGKCMRMYHAGGSPLALCDFCPKAFHVECLGSTLAALPAGEWGCPKCYERQEANKQKLHDLEAKKKEALERVVTAEKKREKKQAKRQQGKEEKDRKRGEGRQTRDSAKRGAAYVVVDAVADDTVDDAEALEEERRTLDTLLAMRGGGDDAAAGSQTPGLLAGHAGHFTPFGSNGSVDLDKVTLDEQIERQQLRLQGPPEPRWVARQSRDAALLRETLSVVEFSTVMQPALRSKPVAVKALYHACCDPAGSSVLPAVYITLLRSCLLELVQLETPLKRSRAKRWGRLLDLHTWPEVLRRYCLATRAGLPMSEEHLRSVDVGAMTADEIAVHAALRLGRAGWWTLPPPLHTRLLSTLCDDISQGTRLRSEISARCEEALQLHTERYHAMAEERKRDKEHAKTRRDKIQTLKDIEARADADNLPTDVKPSAAQLADARTLRNELKGGEAGGDRRDAEERAQQREAEFERRLDGKAVRTEALGRDRHHCSYWSLQACRAALWVETPDGEQLGVLTTPAELHRLGNSLLETGTRERALSQALLTKLKSLEAGMSSDLPPEERVDIEFSYGPVIPDAAVDANGDVNMAVAAAGTPVDSTAAAAQRTGLVDAAIGHLHTLLHVCCDCNLAPDRCSELLARLPPPGAPVRELIEAAREVEAAVCRLSEGLPKEADDANMVEPVQEVEVFRAEFVLPAPPKGEDAEAAAEGGAPGTPCDSSEGDAGTAAGAARASQQVVSALEELDDSDAEPESKSGSTYDEAGNRYPNKPLRIWRTRRDRTVWLKELRRAELAENLPGLVMCCAALLDRSRPMQVCCPAATCSFVVLWAAPGYRSGYV